MIFSTVLPKAGIQERLCPRYVVPKGTTHRPLQSPSLRLHPGGRILEENYRGAAWPLRACLRALCRCHFPVGERLARYRHDPSRLSPRSLGTLHPVASAPSSSSALWPACAHWPASGQRKHALAGATPCLGVHMSSLPTGGRCSGAGVRTCADQGRPCGVPVRGAYIRAGCARLCQGASRRQ